MTKRPRAYPSSILPMASTQSTTQLLFEIAVCCGLAVPCSFSSLIVTSHAVIIVRETVTNRFHDLLSHEGTTQGCSLAMLMYTIRLQPLASRLKFPDHHKQNWYADDSSCVGHLRNIKAGSFPWWSFALSLATSQSLYSTSLIIVNSMVEIVTSRRFLGGCTGAENDVKNFLKKKVSSWVEYAKCLSKTAKAYPQATCNAFTRSLAFE